VGEVLAGTGLQGRRAVPERSRPAGDLEALGFGIVAFACTTCNGMSGALDPKIQQEIIDRDLYATAVLSGNRNFDGRIHPYAKQAFLASPPLVVAYAIAGTVRFDIEKDVLAVVDGKEIRLKDIWPSDEEIDAIVKASVKPRAVPQVYDPDVREEGRAENGTQGQPAVRLAPDVHLHPPPAVLGRRAGR
jgi:aconitase A